MTWQTLTTVPQQLGESPFWHHLEQQLYWVDIPARQILRCNVFTGDVQSWDLHAEPGCVAPVEGGGLVMALRDGVYRAGQWGGPLERLAQLDYPVSTTRANDGKCDAWGRLWIGTYYEPRDQPLAALYCVDARAPGAVQVSKVLDGSQVANGLAWSPDNATLYWSDTGSHVVRAWDWMGAANVLSRPRVLRQFESKPKAGEPARAAYQGRPDGAAVDSVGNYWCAMYEGGRVLKLSPNGEVLADIPTPAQCPTMVCFGGDDFRTLYLTTARQKRPADELQTHPDSGCVFSMRVHVPDLPVNFFRVGA